MHLGKQSPGSGGPGPGIFSALLGIFLVLLAFGMLITGPAYAMRGSYGIVSSSGGRVGSLVSLVLIAAGSGGAVPICIGGGT